MADHQPQPLSHQLARLGLWIDPIRWTYACFHKIGCQFENIDPAYNEYIPNDSWTDASSSSLWSRLVTAVSPGLTELLATHPNPMTRLECLTEILASARPWEEGPFPDRRPGRPFYFQNIRIRNILQYAIFMHREHIRSNPAEDPPRFIGYLDYEELRDLRERKTSFKRRRPSLEGSYFARRCSRWTTNTWTRDPYLLFMLLAIAEARCHLKQDNSSCKSITSRLLLHNWEQDANHIYLYEASFDISLINAIMQQGKTITEIPQITILWKRISLRPYDTFPRRLQQWILDGNLASQETSRNLQSLGKDMTQESHMSHCLAQKKKREKRDADKTKSLSGRRRKFTSKSGHQHQISDRLKSDMKLGEEALQQSQEPFSRRTYSKRHRERSHSREERRKHKKMRRRKEKSNRKE